VSRRSKLSFQNCWKPPTLVPELLEAADPLVDRLQAARVEAVQPLLPGPAHANQPDLAQHAQVLGGARLGHAQRPREVVDRTLPPLQEGQDLAPLGLRDRVERIRRRRHACHRARLYMPI
jgi:hypothetical protein